MANPAVVSGVLVRLTHGERERVKRAAKLDRRTISEWLRLAAIAKLEQERGNGK